MRIDIHQHLWTEQLVHALSRRDRLPFVRHTGQTAILYCAGERPYAIDTQAESPSRRARLVRDERLDLALVAISSPIGIEALPRAEARPLIDAHLDGVSALGPEFAAWGPIPLDRPDPDDIDDLLSRGCAGISIPAGALAGPDALEGIAPLLARAEQRQAPLFIHPGPAPGTPPRETSLTEPLWWPALTDYTAQLQAAWLTFVTVGRRRHPDLTIVFALLAGGAPLLRERLAARGGPPIDLDDPRTFYESSSHGDGAIGAIAELVGADQLVYGSDRPVIDPPPTRWDALLQKNGTSLVDVISAQTVAA